MKEELMLLGKVNWELGIYMHWKMVLKTMVLKTIDLLKNEIPFEEESVVLFEDVKTGLVLIDIINGFCTIGAGNLAPIEPNNQINEMIDELARLAKVFCNKKWPVLALLDSHYPGKLEHPYPHCIIEMVREGTKCNDKAKRLLRWISGSMEEYGSNVFVDWVKNNQIKAVSIWSITLPAMAESELNVMICSYL
ncbi:unnamed protein product [Camellia sinensis]